MVGRLPDIGDVGGDRKARQQAGGESNEEQKQLLVEKKKLFTETCFLFVTN